MRSTSFLLLSGATTGASGLLSKMQPEAVAKLLVETENEWASLSNQKDGEKTMVESCTEITSSLVQASDGDKDKIKEYFGEVCETAKAGEKLSCSAFGDSLTNFLSEDAEVNRDQIDLGKFCTGFWKEGLHGLVQQINAKKAAEEAQVLMTRKAEQEKVRAEAEKKALEAKKKEDEAKKVKEEAEKKAKAAEVEKATAEKAEAEAAKAEAAKKEAAAKKASEEKKAAEVKAVEAKKKAEEAKKAEAAKKKSEEIKKAAAALKVHSAPEIKSVQPVKFSKQQQPKPTAVAPVAPVKPAVSFSGYFSSLVSSAENFAKKVAQSIHSPAPTSTHKGGSLADALRKSENRIHHMGAAHAASSVKSVKFMNSAPKEAEKKAEKTSKPVEKKAEKVEKKAEDKKAAKPAEKASMPAEKIVKEAVKELKKPAEKPVEKKAEKVEKPKASEKASKMLVDAARKVGKVTAKKDAVKPVAAAMAAATASGVADKVKEFQQRINSSFKKM